MKNCVYNFVNIGYVYLGNIFGVFQAKKQDYPSPKQCCP